MEGNMNGYKEKINLKLYKLLAVVTLLYRSEYRITKSLQRNRHF